MRELYQAEGGKFPDPILNLSWAYTTPQSPSLAEVAKEINGKALADLTDENQPGVTIKAGEVLFIPAGAVHAVKNTGSGNAAELATYIVEKGKPLLVPAK